VRLRQGDMAAETVYSDDVPALARQWQQGGATLIHVVDLNGAVDGAPRNLSQIEAIIRTVTVKVQVGGGIRSIETVRRYLGAGATRVVLGTAALTDRSFLGQACREFPRQILLGLDARDGGIGNEGDGHAQGAGGICPGGRDLYRHCPRWYVGRAESGGVAGGG